MSEDKKEGLGQYFEKANEQQVANQQEGERGASSESKNMKVGVPGKYLMKVKTTLFKTKDGELVKMPRTEISDKGAVSLVINLEVVDGTPNVPAGSYFSMYVIMLASPNASKEKIQNTYKYSKPILCALIGQKEIKIEHKWLEEHFLIDYKEGVDGKLVVTREHKMNQEVMVTIGLEIYNDKEKLKVQSVMPARPGDKSIEFMLSVPEQGKTEVQSASSAPTAVNEAAKPAEAKNISLEKSDESFDPDAAANSAVDEY